MTLSETSHPNNEQRAQLRDLWNRVYPQNIVLDGPVDLEQYLSKLEDQRHALLLNEQGRIAGWYFDFVRDNERFFVILLDRSLQGKGHGSALLLRAKERNSELNAWVVNSPEHLKSDGTLYRSPLGFYQRNGFEIVQGKTIEDSGLLMMKIRWNAKN